jgi:hypothetical protein
MKADRIDKLMKEVEKIDIKPCPFCGKQPSFDAAQNRIYCWNEVHCGVHPSTGSYGRWSDLIKDWNQRVNK